MNNRVIWDIIEGVREKRRKVKSRCPHVWGAGRIHIEEATIRIAHFQFREGKVISISENPRSLNDPGKILVVCEECGFRQVYNLRSPVLPRWVTTLVTEYRDRAAEQAKTV